MSNKINTPHTINSLNSKNLTPSPMAQNHIIPSSQPISIQQSTITGLLKSANLSIPSFPAYYVCASNDTDSYAFIWDNAFPNQEIDGIVYENNVFDENKDYNDFKLDVITMTQFSSVGYPEEVMVIKINEDLTYGFVQFLGVPMESDKNVYRFYTKVVTNYVPLKEVFVMDSNDKVLDKYEYKSDMYEDLFLMYKGINSDICKAEFYEDASIVFTVAQDMSNKKVDGRWSDLPDNIGPYTRGKDGLYSTVIN